MRVLLIREQLYAEIEEDKNQKVIQGEELENISLN